MKQIEIITRINNILEEVDQILSKQGFKIIRESHIEDKYKTNLYNKLIRLGDNMNTKTAKLMAKDRVNFIKKFITEYIKEWNAYY